MRMLEGIQSFYPIYNIDIFLWFSPREKLQKNLNFQKRKGILVLFLGYALNKRGLPPQCRYGSHRILFFRITTFHDDAIKTYQRDLSSANPCYLI